MNVAASLLQYLEQTKPEETVQFIEKGRVKRVVGHAIEVSGCELGIGRQCMIQTDGRQIPAEVAGFNRGITYLMALGETIGLSPGAVVVPRKSETAPDMNSLTGRIIDGLGNPLDGKPLPRRETQAMSHQPGHLNPLERSPISEPLDVGIRAINGLLSVGLGQRVGLFAGSGVGKSVLLGMMSRYTRADVTVVALVGERGREVREFVEDNLGSGLSRSIVVASPADDPPVVRLRAAALATEIAETYRAKGKHVLLLMDSLTRVAQAQREIGLTVGEPPTTKGYPPSVFSLLPKLVERAGTLKAYGGSITAFYTVLTEGDDHNDPIADAARAILDGHLILSRRLADSGQYPALDIEPSISRVMPKVVSSDQLHMARRFKELWSRYTQQEDLISVGAYVPGSDPLTDAAIQMRPRLQAFLRQSSEEGVDLQSSRQALADLFQPAQVDAGQTLVHSGDPAAVPLPIQDTGHVIPPPKAEAAQT